MSGKFLLIFFMCNFSLSIHFFTRIFGVYTGYYLPSIFVDDNNKSIGKGLLDIKIRRSTKTVHPDLKLVFVPF